MDPNLVSAASDRKRIEDRRSIIQSLLDAKAGHRRLSGGIDLPRSRLDSFDTNGRPTDEDRCGRVPVDAPHFVFASDGASAVEQALKIAFQYWANRGVAGRTRYLAFGDAYHGDTVGGLSLGDGGFGTTVFDPLRFPVLRGLRLGFPLPMAFPRVNATLSAEVASAGDAGRRFARLGTVGAGFYVGGGWFPILRFDWLKRTDLKRIEAKTYTRFTMGYLF